MRVRVYERNGFGGIFPQKFKIPKLVHIFTSQRTIQPSFRSIQWIVADKRPLYMYMKEMVLLVNFPQNEKKSQIKIASAHIRIPRNN